MPPPPQSVLVVISVHAPPQHPDPVGQATKHWPQFVEELSKSTQMPWQHAGMTPMHVTPQEKQLSIEVELPHTPPQHISEDKHLIPQPPHANGELVVSTQPIPEQLVNPD